MAVLTVEQTLSLGPAGLTSGLADLLIVDIGGRRVLYALSRSENLLFEVEIAANGALTLVETLALFGTFASGSEPLLGHITFADGSNALGLAGMSEASGQSVGLSSNGALGAQTGLNGVGFLTASQTITVGNASLMLSGAQGGGLDLFSDGGSGFGWSAALADTSERYLADVTALVTFTLGTQTFAATASAAENGVNIAGVTATSLTQVGALGVAELLPVGTPEDIAVVQRFGETHLVLASSGTSSLSSISVSSGGTPTLSDHILDSDATAIGGARSLGVVQHGDFAYVAAGGDEGGVSLFTLLPGGRLVHLDTVADDNVLSLERITSVEASVSGSFLQIYGGSFWASDISRLSYDLSAQGSVVFANGQGGSTSGTALDDQVIGSDVSEALAGQAGDDILLDGAGIDTLTGGPGEDLFVLAADGLLDVITDYEVGVDKLDLSAFDFLYDISQLSVTAETDGATITHNAETIRIFTDDGTTLTISDLTNDDILNVDRPPFLPAAQQLIGGVEADTLSGGYGSDTLLGKAGNDSLAGNGGDDLVDGGGGADQIDGGVGNDTLRGQSENDTIAGAAGSDLIFGNEGDDVIYGDDYDWSGA